MAKLVKIDSFVGKDANSYIRLSFEAQIDKAAKTIKQPKSIILPGDQLPVYKELIGFEVTTFEP